MSRTEELEAVDERRGIVRIPTKWIGAVVFAALIPLLVLIFRDLREGISEAKADAKAAAVQAASAKERTDGMADKIDALRVDIRELRGLIIARPGATR